MKRNYGIDTLRIISMIFVIVLHICSYGGVTENVEMFSAQYGVLWLLQAATYCAVDCYALISGYVGVMAKHKYTNLVMLWIQSVFYSVILTIVFIVFGIKQFSILTICKAFFPIMTNRWWYLTKYAIVFLLAPILNAAIKNIPQKG